MDIEQLKDDLREIEGALQVIADGLDIRPGTGGDAVRLVLRRLGELNGCVKLLNWHGNKDEAPY